MGCSLLRNLQPRGQLLSVKPQALCNRTRHACPASPSSCPFSTPGSPAVCPDSALAKPSPAPCSAYVPLPSLCAPSLICRLRSPALGTFSRRFRNVLFDSPAVPHGWHLPLQSAVVHKTGSLFRARNTCRLTHVAPSPSIQHGARNLLSSCLVSVCGRNAGRRGRFPLKERNLGCRGSACSLYGSTESWITGHGRGAPLRGSRGRAGQVRCNYPSWPRARDAARQPGQG